MKNGIFIPVLSPYVLVEHIIAVAIGDTPPSRCPGPIDGVAPIASMMIARNNPYTRILDSLKVLLYPGMLHTI